MVLLAGCMGHPVETGTAVIQTRNWPITQVIIEGPGGDRTTVPFEVIRRTAYTTDFFVVTSILLTLLAALFFFRLWKERGKN